MSYTKTLSSFKSANCNVKHSEFLFSHLIESYRSPIITLLSTRKWETSSLKDVLLTIQTSKRNKETTKRNRHENDQECHGVSKLSVQPEWVKISFILELKNSSKKRSGESKPRHCYQLHFLNLQLIYQGIFQNFQHVDN